MWFGVHDNRDFKTMLAKRSSDQTYWFLRVHWSAEAISSPSAIFNWKPLLQVFIYGRSLVERAFESSPLSWDGWETIPNLSDNLVSGSRVLMRNTWPSRNTEGRFMTGWHQKCILLHCQPNPMSWRSLQPKICNYISLHFLFLIVGASLKGLDKATFWASGFFVCGTWKSVVEYCISLALFFGHFIGKKVNNILQKMFSEHFGMSQWVLRDSLVVFDFVITIKLEHFWFSPAVSQ